MELSRKVALVTGSSRGIGREIARTLAAKGARVAVHYRSDLAAAKETIASLEEGPHALFEADVADAGSARNLVEDAPASAAQDSVVTVEPLVLVQAHRAQGRADRSPTWGEDRSHQQQLGVLPKARLEKSGAKEANSCTILGGRVRTSITSFLLIAVTSVPYPFRSQLAKVEHDGILRS